MRIVLVSDWFAERMGYAENLLSRALAVQGAEVHLVTSDLQPWFPNYKEAYEPFLGPRVQPVGSRSVNGFTVHRLPHGWTRPGIYLKEFHRTLARLRPQVVQCFTLLSWCTWQSAVSRFLLGYKLFLEEHIHASVFPPPAGLRGWVREAAFRLPGPFVSLASERCYPIAPDTARIVTGRLGYGSRKVRICSLGVDTDLFTPSLTPALQDEREKTRRDLGFRPDDIVCVYSGRLSPDKDPACLARAIDGLHRTDPRFRGLFIGAGSRDDLEAVRKCAGCVVHPFVDWNFLPPLYRAADIGVWPRQESTSQLDAAACGLPLILSDHVEVRERYDGNGLTFRQGDADDLARAIRTLEDLPTRRRLGDAGARKMREHFSWDAIARRRIRDYEDALHGRLGDSGTGPAECCRKIAGSLLRKVGWRRGAGPASADYEILPEGAALPTGHGWKSEHVARTQYRAFEPVLKDLRQGRPRQDFHALAEAARATGAENPLVLEVGCGSAWNREVLQRLWRRPFRYVGLDCGHPMLRLARRDHPDLLAVAGDAHHLPFPDASCDVLVSGTVLMHLAGFRRAIQEGARVSRRWCIHHSIPVMRHRPTTLLRKKAYGEETVEVVFNEEALLEEFARQRLQVRNVLDGVPYNLEFLLGEPTVIRTYVCLKED